jgi:3',5'-cyclic AMP phosphodiesterase CpdA
MKRSPTTTTSKVLSSSSFSQAGEQQQNNTTSLVIVDVENVRGKSHFQWTHEGVIACATEWRNNNNNNINAQLYGNANSVLLALVVDHGSLMELHTGGPLDDRVGIFFSGPSQKADDAIVRLLQDNCHLKTTVVTADRDLMMRCQRVSNNLDFSEPMAFLREIAPLELLSGHDYVLRLDMDEPQMDTAASNHDENMNVVGEAVRREVVIRQELQMLNRVLNPKTRQNGKKRQVSRKQRTKLVKQRDRARERLQALFEEETNVMTLSSVLVESSSSSDSAATLLNGVVQTVRRGRHTLSAESTYERQLLAERLRRRLVRAGTTTSSPVTDYKDMSFMHDILLNAKKDCKTYINDKTQKTNDATLTFNRDAYTLASSVLTVPRRFHFGSDDVPSTLLRIVTISDTHGYEHELFHHGTNGEKPHLLPPADVLIHCGDFSCSGSRKIKLQSKARLDAFLAAQTHIPTKIVLRGNHDPLVPARALFPRSQALYATKASTVALPYNVTLGLLPFTRRTSDILALPPCDILASHEPPYGILDLTYQRLRAGSLSLRRAVETSTNKPSLWLCGHIHEGRGSVMHTFVDDGATTADSTLVINAANSNAGKANRIVTGPVLVDVTRDVFSLPNSTVWTVGMSADASPVNLLRPDSLEAMASLMSKTVGDEVSVDCRRLLAVDLGLRTATAVLDGSGEILQVDDWRFTDLPHLEGALEGILLNYNITHVVVEGADMKLVRIWRKAVAKYELPYARVVAEDWREALLLPKERKNKQVAKDAAVLIAKQFWNKKLDHNGSSAKLTKDAAEAVLVGLYALSVLGWGQPVVKRYGNGNVVRT